MNDGLSLTVGQSVQPIPQVTIGDWLDRTVEHFGEREALVVPCQDVRLTWKELRDRVDALAPCSPAMVRRMIADMHLHDITIGYGMTETSPLSTQTSPGADLQTRTDTVGQMLPHFEGRVIDETGALVRLGSPVNIARAGRA